VCGRVPLVVGVGALRTDHAQELARQGRRSRRAPDGAGLLSALTQDEVYQHFRAVAAVTSRSLCIYNNPGTTHFTFGIELLERLSGIGTIRAVKMPLPANGNYAGKLAALRARTDLAIGYSGDWGMADAMLAGADAFYSVLGGLMPRLALSIVRAAKAGGADEAHRIDGRLRRYGKRSGPMEASA
jgi:4-hydroxy-tetrahydrodipicolinate synthase